MRAKLPRCITEACPFHHGKNPNGTCHVEKVDAGISNRDGWREVFDFGKGGGSFCWHPEKIAEQGALF